MVDALASLSSLLLSIFGFWSIFSYPLSKLGDSESSDGCAQKLFIFLKFGLSYELHLSVSEDLNNILLLFIFWIVFVLPFELYLNLLWSLLKLTSRLRVSPWIFLNLATNILICFKSWVILGDLQNFIVLMKAFLNCAPRIYPASISKKESPTTIKLEIVSRSAMSAPVSKKACTFHIFLLLG